MPLLVILFLISCADNANDTASPGTLQTEQQGSAPDTTKLVTDSVLMPDSNTSDIDAMKKIN